MAAQAKCNRCKTVANLDAFGLCDACDARVSPQIRIGDGGRPRPGIAGFFGKMLRRKR